MGGGYYSRAGSIRGNTVFTYPPKHTQPIFFFSKPHLCCHFHLTPSEKTFQPTTLLFCYLSNPPPSYVTTSPTHHPFLLPSYVPSPTHLLATSPTHHPFLLPSYVPSPTHHPLLLPSYIPSPTHHPLPLPLTFPLQPTTLFFYLLHSLSNPPPSSSTSYVPSPTPPDKECDKSEVEPPMKRPRINGCGHARTTTCQGCYLP